MEEKKKEVKEEVKVEKKNNKGLVVIIVVLVLLFGVSAGINFTMLNDKDNGKDDVVEKDKEEEKVEERELNSDEVNLLVNKIETYNHSFGRYFPTNDMSVISEKDLMYFGLDVSFANDGATVEEVENRIKAYFGDDVKITHKDFACPACGNPLYKYDEANGKYTIVRDNHGHGGSLKAYFPDIDVKYLEGNLKDGIYTVKVKVLYSNTCGDTCGGVFEYYKSYKDAISHTNAIATVTNDYVSEQEKESFRANAVVSAYKFKKNSSGNLVLISME